MGIPRSNLAAFIEYMEHYEGRPKPKALLVNRSAIQSGDMVEVWEYENPIAIRLERQKKALQAADEHLLTDEELKDKRIKNHWESYHTFCRLVVTNFGKYSKFLTLTFADDLAREKGIDIKDIASCNRAFKLFIDRMRDRYGKEFKYIATIEFQDRYKRGAVHYHLVIDIPYTPKKELEKVWGLGIVDIREIKEAERVMLYIGKYMRKGLLDDRLIGKRKYWGSRNLIKPNKVYNQDVNDLVPGTEKRESLRKCYFSAYHNGTVTYTRYYKL